MKELLDYIRFNKISRKRLYAEIRDERDKKLPQRNVFDLLKKFAKDYFEKGAQPRMIALSGLRGVGKTTLMWQIAKYVSDNKFAKEIYFISVDDLNRLNASIYDVINILEKEIYKCALSELNNKIMLMIDEVHEAKDWQKDIKILYEKGKKIFVITTGSSALLLNSSSDLASRWQLIKIFPFKFSEFVLSKSWLENSVNIFPVKGLSAKLKDSLFYSKDYNSLKNKMISFENEIKNYLKIVSNQLGEPNNIIDEYISYHNIARFLSVSNKILIKERVLALFERILSKDIPEIDNEHFYVYYRILLRIALSDEINFQTLSKTLRIKESKIEKMILTLNNAEILNIFLPYAGIKSKTGINKKVFFMSPSLRRALYSKIYGDKLSNGIKAKLYEDIIAMYLKKNLTEGIVSFGIGKKKNPDFIIETLEKPIVMEIGINKLSKSQVISYTKYRYGLIINTKIDTASYDDKNKIIFLPLSWFLLM